MSTLAGFTSSVKGRNLSCTACPKPCSKQPPEMSLVYILTALVCVSLLHVQDAGGCKKNSETSTQLNDVEMYMY